MSSWGGGALLVSSTITVSLLVSLRGGLRFRDTSIVSLRDRLEGGLRGELRRGELRRGERDLRRTTTSSSTEDISRLNGRVMKIEYMSHNTNKNAATEPKTMPTTVPGVGPALRPEYVVGITEGSTCRRKRDARDRVRCFNGSVVYVGVLEEDDRGGECKLGGMEGRSERMRVESKDARDR